MHHRLIAILLLSAVCCSGFAQGKQAQKDQAPQEIDFTKRTPTLKELIRAYVWKRDENAKLKAEADSLKSLVDTLQKQNEEIAAVSAGTPDVEDTPETAVAFSFPKYDPSGFFEDFEDFSEDSTDVERFSNDVPDAVLIRRLEDMNCVVEIPFNQTVRNYMILYTEKNPHGMERLMGLAKFYFPIFEDALNRYDLPLEIKYLSIIESALKPLAKSPAGAFGLWQFMFGPAKQYGLRITNYVDERADILKSVDAAARVLQDAYSAFGDWSLALSSYNCGPGNVQRAIRQAGSTKFWDIYPYLPKETRNYVPAFVGAMYAMTYYKEHGLHPEDNPMPGQMDTIHINKKLHFRQINEMVGVPMDVLTFLNPQYLRQVIPGNEDTYVLLLPQQWAIQFHKFDIEDIYAFKSDELFKSNVVTGGSSSSSSSSSQTGSQAVQAKGAAQQVHTTYKVKKGDTLAEVASRYHVKTTDIQRWNHMKSSMLIAGSTIHIYLPPGSKIPSSGSSSSYKSSSVTTHTVKAGETLSGIAQKYGVGLTSLKNINGLKSNTIKAGQKLRIPAK